MADAAPKSKCPICGKPTAAALRPFCSPRCRDVDLNRWLSGAYVIPGAALEEEEAPARGEEDSEA